MPIPSSSFHRQSPRSRRAFKSVLCATAIACLPLAAQQVEPHAETGEPVWVLADFSQPQQAEQQWKVGGWQGKATNFEADITVTGGQALRVDYTRHDPNTYFRLYRRGNWDLSNLTHFSMRFKGTELNQRILLHLTDAEGNWTVYGGRAWWCRSPGEWQRNNARLVKPYLPRKAPYADLNNIVYIAFQIQPPPDSPSGTVYLDDLEFFMANVLKNGGFEAGDVQPEGWKVTGNVHLDTREFVEGDRSVRLERDEDERTFPAVESVPFRLEPGLWEIRGALKSEDMFSPDPSFNAGVSIEAYNRRGKRITSRHIDAVQASTPWKSFRQVWRAPSGTHTAKLTVRMNKTFGTAWADGLTVTRRPSSDRKQQPDVAFAFTSDAVGNLFYPDDPQRMTVTVSTRKPLPADQRTLRYEVRNYWGSRLIAPREASLSKAELEGGRHIHTASLDVSDAGLEANLYYELHVVAADGAGSVSEDSTSFAILPEAEANRYPPEQIPFGTQGWTLSGSGSKTATAIARRLGCRWVRYHFDWPQEKAGGPIVWDRLKDYWVEAKLKMPVDMGLKPYYTIVPGMRWERGSENYLVEDLRRGIFESVERLGDQGLRAFKLGNEPPGWEPALVERSVRGYEAMYKGIKEADEDALVVSTSVNNNHERYLKADVGKYCDILDIHLYRDIQNQRNLTRQFLQWAEKYGTKKPLWCTELGTKGMGLSRRKMAIDCIAKQVVFFADGGCHVDWFALQALKIHAGTFKDAFCVIRVDNTPRLDAVAYYHLINRMTTKTFADEQAWNDGTRAFLFRDAENHCMLALWNAKGASDLFVPLQGVDTVTATYLDGRRRTLQANGEGITLRVGEEPVLLNYTSDMTDIAERPGTPRFSAPADGPAIVPGSTIRLTVRRTPQSAGTLDVEAPPLWSVRRDGESADSITFRVTSPADTPATTARFYVRATDGAGNVRGELAVARKVAPKLSVVLAPAPAQEGGAVAVRVQNNSAEERTVHWSADILKEVSITDGVFQFDQATAAQAYFTRTASGTVTVSGKNIEDIRLDMAGVNPQTLYRIRATIRKNGESSATETWLGGFVGVPRANTSITVDGNLDEAAWEKAPVLSMDERRQMYGTETTSWDGPKDLSGDMRLLWDENNLYIAVEVVDDVFRNVKKDQLLWAGDGLQFLVDPYGAQEESEGFYDYLCGSGAKGDQMWCGRTAHAEVPIGELPESTFASSEANNSPGGRIYEIAMPWSRLKPLTPAAGSRIGFSLVINEDDGGGRFSFMCWFSGVSMKKVAHVGDIILVK